MSAQRKTPTQANGGSDDGILYTNAVNTEIEALWTSSHGWLVNVGGTANAIIAQSDDALVDPITAYARPMSFYLVPSQTNSAAVQINIDSMGFIDLRDAAGNPLAGGELLAGNVYAIVYDGARFRVIGVRAGGATVVATAPDAIFEDQKPSGSHGGTFQSGAWRVRNLNTTVRNVISGASLNAASGEFTLPAGYFWIEWSAPAFCVRRHKTRLFNVTDGLAPNDFLGSSEYAYYSYGERTFVTSVGFGENPGYSTDTIAIEQIAQTRSFGAALVSISAAKTFRLEHRCELTRNSDGFGLAAAFGDAEKYSRISIWKQ
ncbi:MAG TPA: hypothetical protein VNK48_07355 [Xanthobacteraceae bacterium]|nr:hypothetical protein [Xanthobacteraceae bacterium]